MARRLLNIVFTGPAHNAKGKLVLRADLIVAARKAGFVVQSAVGASTELLVASRTDTRKARAAKARGIKMTTYPEFLRRRLRKPVKPTGAKFNPWTDRTSAGSAEL
jgi:NAD-dependent DNA ligase